MWKKDNFSSFSGFHGRKLFLFCVCFLAQFVSMKFDNSIKDWAYFTSIDTTIELDTNLFNYGVYLSQMRLKFTILNVTANEEDNFGFGFLFAPSLNISSLDYDTSLNTYNYTLDTNVSALYFCSKESVKGWTAITLTENFKSFDPSWSKRIPIHGQQYCYYNASSKSLNGNLLIDPRWPNDMTIIPDQIAYQVIIFDDDPSRHENNNSTSLAKNVQAPTYTYKIPFSLNMVQKACSSIGSQCLFQTINHSDLLYKFDEIECDSKDFGLKKPSTCVSAVVTHTSGNLIHLVGYMHSTALNDSFQIDLDLPTNADLREKTVLQFVCKRGQIPGNRIFLKDSKYTINSQTINNTQYSDRVLLMCAWQIPNVISFNIDRKSISFLLLDQETTLKMTTKRDHENYVGKKPIFGLNKLIHITAKRQSLLNELSKPSFYSVILIFFIIFLVICISIWYVKQERLPPLKSRSSSISSVRSLQKGSASQAQQSSQIADAKPETILETSPKN